MSHQVAWNGMKLHQTAWNGMKWHEMAWNGMEWHEMTPMDIHIVWYEGFNRFGIPESHQERRILVKHGQTQAM